MQNVGIIHFIGCSISLMSLLHGLSTYTFTAIGANFFMNSKIFSACSDVTLTLCFANILMALSGVTDFLFC
jgi:hypothetical protein